MQTLRLTILSLFMLSISAYLKTGDNCPGDVKETVIVTVGAWNIKNFNGINRFLIYYFKYYDLNNCEVHKETCMAIPRMFYCDSNAVVSKEINISKEKPGRIAELLDQFNVVPKYKARNELIAFIKEKEQQHRDKIQRRKNEILRKKNEKIGCDNKDGRSILEKQLEAKRKQRLERNTKRRLFSWERNK